MENKIEEMKIKAKGLAEEFEDKKGKFYTTKLEKIIDKLKEFQTKITALDILIKEKQPKETENKIAAPTEVETEDVLGITKIISEKETEQQKQFYSGFDVAQLLEELKKLKDKRRRLGIRMAEVHKDLVTLRNQEDYKKFRHERLNKIFDLMHEIFDDLKQSIEEEIKEFADTFPRFLENGADGGETTEDYTNRFLQKIINDVSRVKIETLAMINQFVYPSFEKLAPLWEEFTKMTTDEKKTYIATNTGKNTGKNIYHFQQWMQMEESIEKVEKTIIDMTAMQVLQIALANAANIFADDQPPNDQPPNDQPPNDQPPNEHE